MQVNEGVDGDPDDNYTDKPMTGCGSAAEGGLNMTVRRM